MKSFSASFSIVAAFAALFSQTTPTLSLNLPQGPNILEGCGGVIKDEAGSIRYKSAEPFLSNERCVWILKPPTGMEYNLTLTQMGFPTTNQSYGLTLQGAALRKSGGHYL